MTDAAHRPASLEATAALADTLADERVYLVATARVLGFDASDAEDLAQATLEIGLRHLAELRDRNALRAWLHKIELREASRLWRRMRRVLLGSVADVDPPPDPELVMLRTAVSRLPRKTREAIVLHHMVGLQVAEVATAQGVSRDAVKARLKDGLKKLREELGNG